MSWLRPIDVWLIDAVMPHAADLRQLAARLIGRDEADDVVHEVYARLLGYAQWQQIENARAFALRTLRNLAYESLRRTAVVTIDQLAELETLDLADDAPDSFRVSSGRQELTQLLAVIEELPPQCGRVLRLRKLEGRSPREIAVLLGLSVSTVEKHLSKGLALITERMRSGDYGEGTAPRRTWSRRRNRA